MSEMDTIRFQELLNARSLAEERDEAITRAMTPGSFELGDSVVLMREDFFRTSRKPVFEGRVTARGEDCIRVIYRRKLFSLPLWMKEKWHATEGDSHHFSKTKSF